MIKRREFLKGALLSGVIPTSLANISSPKEPLKVSAFGGFFQKAFESSICKQFTEETNIPITTMSQGQGDDWLFPLIRAVRGGLAPMDVTILDEVGLIKLMGMGDIVKSLNLDKMTNAGELTGRYLFQYDGRTFGVGVMEWYQNIVTNPEVLVSPPTSWRQLFEDDLYKGKIGLIGLYDGGMIEVVAKTYFDGNETLNTRAGIRAVIEKVGKLKEQVGFWWTAESQMEQAIRSQNVIAGSFFHDVALLLKEDNFPIDSTFPIEGSFTGINKLCIPSTSKRTQDAEMFIDFCARPDNQARFAREMRLAPVISQKRAGLNDIEFSEVSTSIEPIPQAAQTMVKDADYLQRLWQRMITS